MLQEPTIQPVKYCRSRAYGVFSTYLLRGYYKRNAREVDREKVLKRYLWERGGETSILRNLSRSSISTPWSPQSLTLTRFGRWKAKIAQGLDGGEREATGRERGAVKL
jgi:hypothetical protein